MFAYRSAGLLAGATYKVGSVTVQNPGTNEYTSAPTISFTGGGGGSGAAATPNMAAVVYSGAVATVFASINTGAYSLASALPSISITGGGGSGALAAFTTWGSGFVYQCSGVCEVSGPSASFSFSGGGGSGASAANQNTLYPRRASVAAVSVSSGGSGYTVAPSVVFTIRPGFTTVTLPTATANLSAGQVVSITVTNAGEYIRDNSSLSGWNGYTVSLSGGNGSGASVNAFHTVTAITYWAGPDATNAYDGAVGFTITAGGTNYTSSPTLTASGATGVANSLSVTCGRYPQNPTVSAGGSGYTSAPSATVSGGTGLGSPTWSTSVSGTWYTNYRVNSITVTNQGSGYRSVPTVVFVGGSPITPASAVANLV